LSEYLFNLKQIAAKAFYDFKNSPAIPISHIIIVVSD